MSQYRPTTYSYLEALTKLDAIGENRLLDYFEELSPLEKSILLNQIEHLNIDFVDNQKQILNNFIKLKKPVSPYQDYDISGCDKRQEIGNQILEKGLVGCLLIAGGQGSRLGFNGPKGCFPISPIKNKSLFQIFIEKIKAAGNCFKQNIPLAIMTSPLNHHQTIRFFEDNDFFNFTRKQISFFLQPTLPLLNSQGNPFLERPYSIAQGPDGNGSALKSFYTSNIFRKWMNKGIRYVTFTLIDNPLADPLDNELIAHCSMTNSDMILKAIERKDINESLGLIVSDNNQLRIIEYTEIREEDFNATENNKPKFNLANTSLFCFDMTFIEKIALTSLPLHVANKKALFLNPSKQSIRPVQPNAYKFERFIFDLLHHTSKVRVLLYPKKSCFAPLKNKVGLNSPKSVQAALYEKDREVLKNINKGLKPTSRFELAPEFYYPTKALRKAWSHKTSIEKEYITP